MHQTRSHAWMRVRMSETERPTAAFIISLLAGIFVLLGGGMKSMMGSWFVSNGFGMMSGARGWMMGGNYPAVGYGMMGGFGFGILGLIFGTLVIICAVILNQRPHQHQTWGLLILLFSVLSMISGVMGLGVGLILGVIGGVLAIVWTPNSK